MLPISKPNTQSANLSQLPSSRRPRCRRRPRVQLLQLQSRLRSCNSCYIGIAILNHAVGSRFSRRADFTLEIGEKPSHENVQHDSHISYMTPFGNDMLAAFRIRPGRLLNMPHHGIESVCVWVEIHLWKSKILAASLFSLPDDSSRTKPNADSALRRQREN